MTKPEQTFICSDFDLRGTWRNMFVPDYHAFKLNRSASGLFSKNKHGFDGFKKWFVLAVFFNRIKHFKQTTLIDYRYVCPFILHFNYLV